MIIFLYLFDISPPPHSLALWNADHSDHRLSSGLFYRVTQKWMAAECSSLVYSFLVAYG